MRRFVAVALSTIISLASAGSLWVTAAVPHAYYIDCNKGSDDNTGVTPVQAWKTLDKGSQVHLMPGDHLLLKRDCVWNGSLTLSDNGTASQPIYVSTFGTGEYPTIWSNQSEMHPVVISGNYYIIENLSAVGIAPAHDVNCDNTGVGLIVGFLFSESSSYNVLRNSKATGLTSGVRISLDAHNNLITGNVFVDNNMMEILSPTALNDNDDTGAFGVEVIGNANEIAYNTISGGNACSYDYGHDGSAIEIYKGNRNKIHHNWASDNDTFTELGYSGASDNIFAYNVVTSSLPYSNFLVTRGPEDFFGPVWRTKAYNNTVYLTGSTSIAVSCTGGCDTNVLTLKNNIFWGENIIGYSDQAISEGHNVAWRSDGKPEVYFGPQEFSTSSKKAHAEFVDIAAGDFHLQASSPAIDMGTAESIGAGYNLDFDGKVVGISSAVDVGAYEFAPPTLPTTTPLDGKPSLNYFTTATPMLTWNRIPGATAYELQVATNNAFTNVIYTFTDNSLSNIISVILPDGLYFWRVRAIDATGGYGVWSAYETFTIGPIP